MCACRFEEMQQMTSPIFGDLEEYLSEVESRRNASDPDDIYAQIAQKEKDLVLAAELGKALLERNEELSRANEKLTEDYSHKLGLLEQEKHALRRRLDAAESEYDSRVADLTADIAQLRAELAEHQALLRASEADRTRIVSELSDQNLRLTQQLKQSTKEEEQLQAQLASLRDQFNARKSNLHDQVSQLESLREEINFLTERKAELERRIGSLHEERETLSLSLDESSDRIHLLERKTREQEQMMRNQQRDLEQLRQTNLQLQERLDAALRAAAAGAEGGPHSLFNEIEMCSQSSIEDELRSLNDSTQGPRSRPHSHPGSSVGFHGDMDDDFDLPFAGIFPGETEDNYKLRQEFTSVYAQLVRMCKDLRQRKDCSSADSGISTSPEDIRVHHLRVGMLSAVLKDLKVLIEEALSGNEDMPCESCQSTVEERIRLEKLEKELKQKDEELRKKDEVISSLTTKMTVQEQTLAAVREERDHLRQDVNDSTLSKDQIVKKAWEMRDQAVARKNHVEIELAKTRIDLMHSNSQLMEVIQKKVELAQQVEQWQMDMESLIGEQVVKKLQTQEDRRRRPPITTSTSTPTSQQQQPSANDNSTPKSSKIFNFWR